MIRGIIFDCFGVLYEGSLSTLTNLCPPDKQQELRDANKSADYGYIEQDEYEKIVGELIGKTAPEVRDIRRQKHIRNNELIDFAFSLKSQYKVGMLSNVSRGGLDGLFSDKELNDDFDTVVMSWEVGLTKPHPEIFMIAAEKLGLRPEECVMIDDLITNCEGASVVGMKPIQHISNKLTIKELDRILGSNA